MYSFYKPTEPKEPPKESKTEIAKRAKPSQPLKEESKDGIYVVPDTRYYPPLAAVWCGLGGSGGD